MTKKYTAKGAEALLAASFFYAFTAILIREVAPMWGDKAQVTARWSLAFFILLAFALYKKTNLKIHKNQLLPLSLLSTLFVLVVMFFTVGVQRTTVANSLFIFFAVSMLTAFIAGTFMLKESITRAKIIALIFSFCGLMFFADQIFAGSSGIVLCAIAGVFGGLTTLLYKLLKKVDNNLILIFQYGTGSILAVAATLLSGDEIIRQASLKVTLLTVVFAFVLIVATSLIVYGYRYFDVNVGSAITSSEIVFGVILAYILYKEVPNNQEIVGGSLILIGSIIGSLNFEALKDLKRLD